MTQRRENDAYFTPTWATEVLLSKLRIDEDEDVLEPCAGDSAIAKVIRGVTHAKVFTNDIDPVRQVDFHDDAVRFMTDAMEATAPEAPYDWIMSNPPFLYAPAIVSRAYKAARLGVAMLLRISFLEPCDDRKDFLKIHPPDYELVLPRISFTLDGRHDNATCAWYVWYTADREFVYAQPRGIEVYVP